MKPLQVSNGLREASGGSLRMGGLGAAAADYLADKIVEPFLADAKRAGATDVKVKYAATLHDITVEFSGMIPYAGSMDEFSGRVALKATGGVLTVSVYVESAALSRSMPYPVSASPVEVLRTFRGWLKEVSKGPSGAM